MNIKQMILIDRMLGQIICYFLFLFQKLSTIKNNDSEKKHKDNFEEILIIKFWGIGSILLATPAIQNIKRRYPNAKITILTLSQNRRFCKTLKTVDRIITFSLSPSYKFIFNFIKLIKDVSRERYDLLFDLEFGVNFSAIVAFFIKADKKIGFDAVKYWRGKLYLKKIPFDHGRHISRIFNKMIRSADDFPVDELNFEDIYNIDPKEEKRFIDRLYSRYRLNKDAHIIVLNINASDLNQNRRWPLEYYIDLSKELTKHEKNKILLIGLREDKEYVGKFVSCFSGNNVIDLSGELEIEELIYLIKNCDIFIGNDSGPLHIACTFNKPTVSFFGPETPMLYGPPADERHIVFYKDIYCSPCLNIYNSKTFICHDNQCLKQIRPEEVKKRIGEALSLKL